MDGPLGLGSQSAWRESVAGTVPTGGEGRRGAPKWLYCGETHTLSAVPIICK